MSDKWPSSNPKNIIVRMPNWLGDAVMATPVLQDLRHFYKDAKITAMCQSSIRQLLEHDPHLSEIFAFPKVNGWVHTQKHVEILDPLIFGGYDLGILLTNSFSSAWWFWRGKVKNRLGYSTHCRSLLLNKAVAIPEKIQSQHQVITYKMLLDPLGIPLSATDPHLYVSFEEMANAKQLLAELNVDDQSIIVGINPGAAYGTAKCWPADRYKQVTRKLVENPAVRVVYFGDPTGATLVNEICSDMPDKVVNLAGKTNLRELMALIKLCHIFLTNDSGPMHMASALGTPLIALFGSTSDIKTGPYKGGKVIHKHVECSPCYKRICPIDFRCMMRIEVEEVYQELEKLIKK